MMTLIAGSLILSVLHALIPSHWLPVLAIGRKESWSLTQTTNVTFIAGFAHAISTVLIGVFIGVVGIKLAGSVQYFTRYIAPSVLIALGVFYVYQHHRHKHFHLHSKPETSQEKKVVVGLVLAMFFSPCFEIEAYFLLAGTLGWQMVLLIGLLYTIVTIAGMVVWVRLTYQGLLKINWHSLEHNAGIITGATLILSGVISFILQ